MYLDYWHLERKPFENTPDPEFFFFSVAHKDAYMRFKYALSENKGAILLTGEYGCGKTTLIRLLISELSADEEFDFALLNIPRGDGRDLLSFILSELGQEDIPTSMSEIGTALGSLLLDSFMAGKSTVVVVDEAQLIQDQETLGHCQKFCVNRFLSFSYLWLSPLRRGEIFADIIMGSSPQNGSKTDGSRDSSRG